MTLRWVLDDVVVDESTFEPGKELWLEAQAPTSAPQLLQVYQVYSSAMRQILTHVGVSDRRAVGDFTAVSLPPDRYRSDRQWRLPEPRGWRKSASFIFLADVSDKPSGPVYSSRLGKAKLGLGGSAELKEPTSLVPIGVSGSGSIKAALHFATDPTLSIEVLTGEALVEHMLRNLTEDIGRRDDPEFSDVAARIEFELPGLRTSLLEAYTPPGDWRAILSETTISGSPGYTAQITVSLETPSKGGGYFAVSFYDPDSPDDSSETADAWAVEVDADLNISVRPDPADTPLPRLEFA